MTVTLTIALAAIVFDAAFAYPALLQQRFGHPVQWMGSFIDWCDQRFNTSQATPKMRRQAGIIMLAVMCLLLVIVAVILTVFLRALPFGWIIEALIGALFLAQRQLASAVRNVAYGLEGSLVRGREAVAEIVGRDVSRLDEAGVSRAAVETLAENASDGVYAPLFYLLVFGLPGIVVYKAINTADSMVGHNNERFRDFGWASAKLDDVVNWIPARLTALLIACSAVFLPGASISGALRAALRDGPKHTSPNAGWPEAAMAGALGFGLGGPRSYKGKKVDLPHMGSGRRFLSPKDIRRALVLYATMGVITALILLAFILITR